MYYSKDEGEEMDIVENAKLGDKEAFNILINENRIKMYKVAKSILKNDDDVETIVKEQMNSNKSLFSTCFEFGTIGDGFLDSIISMKYTIEENQNHWNPSSDSITNQVIKERYQELFYPTEKEWREKTVADFAKACKGVLDAKLISE